MRFSVLASGSRGNSVYVEAEDTKILIDAGLSCRELVRRLDIINARPSSFDALVVTHEHSDHIRGAGPVVRRFDIPLYINDSTFKEGMKSLGTISRQVTVRTGQTLRVNNLEIETFTKCHDAADPMGLIISYNGSRLGIITDLGKSTRLVEERLKNCNALIIEFNHDIDMLDNGSYPLNLKRRIKGRDGHLSNKQAGDLLKNVVCKKLSKVVLAHLSQENNLPEIAYRTAKEALIHYGARQPEILISLQDQPMPLMDI